VPVFLVGAGFSAIGFVLAWFLREIPLRTLPARADHGPELRRHM
jgi:hypothetical protein